MTPAPPLWTLVDRNPDALAIRDARRALTWLDFDRETTQFGHGLESLGLAPGDHVSVAARNHVDYLVATVGIMRAGMIITPVKTGWTASEIEYLLTDANSRAVVTDIPAARDAAAARGIPIIDFAPSEAPAYASWLAGQDDSPLPEDRCGWRLSYTSGTTGRPKGVVREGSGTVPFTTAFVAGAAFAAALQIPRDGIHLVVSRLFHGAPLAFALNALATGTPLHIMDRWDAADAVDLLAGTNGDGAASSIMVPTMFRQMLALPDEQRARLPVPSLKVIIHGGEPCPIGLKQRMIDWLGPIFIEYFGVSEGGMTLASTGEWLARPGTVGRIHTAADVVILDDDGNEVPPGTEGAVYFKSSGAPFFYQGDPEKTASAFRGNAFTAGDIGFVDADGYLFLSGRRADVIVSAGVNIYPAEIETVLDAVPGVADLCVVAGPDEERGEVPMAVVVVAEGHEPTAVIAALQAHAETELAGYKRPARYIVEASLPRDDTGKLLRRHVRDALWGDESPFAVTRR